MEPLKPSDFDFALPSELIAQEPAPRRDGSRLLVLDRAARTIKHRMFPDLLEYLRPADALVLNDSRVIAARLRARKPGGAGRFEILLVEEIAANEWWAMLRPGKRAPVGTSLEILRENQPALTAVVTEVNAEGHRRLRFEGGENILLRLDELGEVPLPPYIERAAQRHEDRERYQTVFADSPGSVAAPTAGLHFTTGMLDQVRARSARVCFVTLHVALGTFAPVKADALSDHTMHEERFSISPETAGVIAETRAAGGRVIAVGTTTLRVLESAALVNPGNVVAGTGKTRLFAYPPFDFKIVNGLLTNFHLPRSTLLMLVSAFAAPGATVGRELALKAYGEAVREHYRFFSYGDAMLLI
jgi:S-adenosylmethionine:tRNA ribosyltransferase-isomerase